MKKAIFVTELENYRKEIDELDEELMRILKRRFEIVRAVGHFKAENNVEVVQSKRAEFVKKRAADRARKANIDPNFIYKFYEDMIDLAHVIENEILEKTKK